MTSILMIPSTAGDSAEVNNQQAHVSNQQAGESGTSPRFKLLGAWHRQRWGQLMIDRKVISMVTPARRHHQRTAGASHHGHGKKKNIWSSAWWYFQPQKWSSLLRNYQLCNNQCCGPNINARKTLSLVHPSCCVGHIHVTLIGIGVLGFHDLLFFACPFKK